MFFVCAWFILSSCALLAGETRDIKDSASADERAEWFEREVRPLLAERCFSCHSSGLEAPKANLKLDRREFLLAGGDSGPAIVVGKPNASLLLQAVRGEGLQMPPEQPLTKVEQGVLERWLELGAPWPETQAVAVASGPDWLVARAASHWAWQPVAEPELPKIDDSAWPARRLDVFIVAKLEALQLPPATSAERVDLLRRLAFDLTGLPPTPEQASEFAAARDPEEAYARLVDEYLAAPALGVTWGRHWLDLVRYCETLGHEFDFPLRHAWRYRDAVIDAFNSDVSYANFVSEHIAGDLVTSPRRHPLTDVNQSLALTGWWWMGEGLHAPVDIWSDEAARLDNQIDVYSKTFLGMTVACARCHDHKFDALSAADYTSLVGILQSSRRTYAYDDPHSAIAEHNQRLAEKLQQLSAGIAPDKHVAEFENWIAKVVVQLQENIDASRQAIPLHHPLYPLLLLAEAKSPDDFAKRREVAADELLTAAQKFEQWQADSPQLADFSSGLPEGWYVETTDPRIGSPARSPSKLLGLDPVAILPLRHDAFTSVALGKQQHLSLRSPTFDLTHPIVALRMRGKSVQSSIVVDNYFMNEFQGLLFADMRKPIDQPHDTGWIVHRGDLSKYIHHPAYVSIEDDENGWFELSEVRLANAPPPDQPHELSLRWLLQPILTADELTRQMSSALAAAHRGTAERFSKVVNNSSVSDRTSAEVELLRSAIIEGARLKIPLEFVNADSDALQSLAAKTPAPTRLIAVHEGTPRNAALAIRGDPHARGDALPRADLQALGGQPFDEPTSSGRSELARSLTSGQHPLVARVMVNRVWLHLVGQGLVDSPDNFGLLGGAPSHRELLDYLTLRFIEHDWSIKWLIREICLSRTYRLSSFATPEQLEKDPTSRMLSHRQVRRLSAEKLRDAMLAVSGSLDRATQGESIKVHLSEQMTGRGRPDRSGPVDADGRRSAFIEVRRNFLDPFLIAFDQPPPATTVGKRNLSNVPAQALSMLNDPLVHELAGRWSDRVMTDEASHEQRVRAMFLSAFARQPTGDELIKCLEPLEAAAPDQRAIEASLAELAHVLMCTKEFQYLK